MSIARERPVWPGRFETCMHVQLSRAHTQPREVPHGRHSKPFFDSLTRASLGTKNREGMFQRNLRRFSVSKLEAITKNTFLSTYTRAQTHCVHTLRIHTHTHTHTHTHALPPKALCLFCILMITNIEHVCKSMLAHDCMHMSIYVQSCIHFATGMNQEVQIIFNIRHTLCSHYTQTHVSFPH